VNRIDDIALHSFFAPIAGLAEHRLGIGQWRLSIECLNGHVAFYVAGVALGLIGKGMTDGIFATLLVSLAWLLLMEAVRNVARRQAGSSLGVQTARMREWHFRLIVAAMLPLSLTYVRDPASACYTASLFLLLCHLGFKACDAPPPQQRRRLAHGRA
jgi:hypothetical protein